MKARIEISGGLELAQRMRSFGVRGVDAAKRVLNEATAKVVPLAKAQTPYDDIEEGPHVVDTIRATKARATAAGRISAGVVAGPVDARGGNIYVVVQHEDVTLKHDEGGAKFVERPMFQVAPSIPDALISAFDRLLEP